MKCCQSLTVKNRHHVHLRIHSLNSLNENLYFIQMFYNKKTEGWPDCLTRVISFWLSYFLLLNFCLLNYKKNNKRTVLDRNRPSRSTCWETLLNLALLAVNITCALSSALHISVLFQFACLRSGWMRHHSRLSVKALLCHWLWLTRYLCPLFSQIGLGVFTVLLCQTISLFITMRNNLSYFLCILLPLFKCSPWFECLLWEA